LGSLLKSKKSTNFNFTGAIKLALKVTIFTDGTFRIAVFMAKGGYKNVFYLNVSKNKFSSIEDLTPVYIKPFNAYWHQNVGEYIYELSDKIFT